MFKTTLLAAATAAVLAVPAFAQPVISITDAYARAAGKMAMAGAAFMVIRNDGDEDDRLIDARSDVAKVVELHTHVAGDNGVMKMRRVEGGFPVPAHGEHVLKRGGDHIMFMGLKEPFEQGKVITVTLVFEKTGEMTVEIPVDLTR